MSDQDQPWGFSDHVFWSTPFPELPGWEIHLLFVGTGDPYESPAGEGQLALRQIRITTSAQRSDRPQRELSVRALTRLRLGELISRAKAELQETWVRKRFTEPAPGRPRLTAVQWKTRLAPIAQLYLLAPPAERGVLKWMVEQLGPGFTSGSLKSKVGQAAERGFLTKAEKGRRQPGPMLEGEPPDLREAVERVRAVIRGAPPRE
jgi:hypothetical protein